MDEKKPSTADILAKIRAQKAAAASSAPPAAPEAPAAEAPAAAEPPAPAVEAVAPKPAAPATPAAKPGSTKDILAAIRAKGAGGAAPAAPAAAATPAAPVTAAPVAATAAAAKPAAPAGPKQSVQDMLKALREAKPGEVVAPAAAVKAPVAAPPAPVRPVPAGKKAPAPPRRSLAIVVTVAFVSLACFVGSALTGSVLLFLAGMLVWSLLMTPFMAAWASLTEVTALWTLHTARFMMPNVLVEPPSRFKVGPVSDYPLNTVSNKWKDQFGIWVVHTDQYEGQNLIFALASVCTHLGCTPSWLDGEQKFKCPCHGSGFYITGVNFEGPAPRPLERMGIRIAEGMLEVDKSMKFQEEMGQWTDAASFVSVS